MLHYAQILATNAFTGAAGTNTLSIYKVTKNASSAVLMYGPLKIAAGLSGTPGGIGAGAHLCTLP